MSRKNLAKRRRMLEGLRRKMGMNKTKFAGFLGLSNSHYHMILSGQRSIPAEVAYQLAIDLGLAPEGIEPLHNAIYRSAFVYWERRENRP